jgi:outer membrane immunogenic protein
MKKLAALLAFSTVLAFGATAQAAEMVEPTIYDWTGFYVGGNIGYGFEGRDRVGAQPTEPGVKGDNDLGELKIQGIFGGGQIGADWQTGSFVFGAIADVEGADIHDDFTTKTSSLSDNVHGSDDIDVWGTFRGRAGWAFDRWLVYGTGGLAWADVDYNLRITPGAKDDEIGKPDAGLAGQPAVALPGHLTTLGRSVRNISMLISGNIPSTAERLHLGKPRRPQTFTRSRVS